ncbi:MAG: peptide deformylase [Bdellovibrionales bacterium]|nr:peptide deformylase [Bdellovibrionales bacterium]
MSVKSILKLGDPILREKCAAIEDASQSQDLFQDLRDTLRHVQTLYQFPRGCGLAAPQIGYTQRATIIEYDGDQRLLVNPEIVEASREKMKIREGCLSFFDYRGQIERHRYVKVRAQDRNGKTIEIEGSDDLSCLLQHEIDHLNGVLYFDYSPNGQDDLRLIDGMPVIP